MNQKKRIAVWVLVVAVVWHLNGCKPDGLDSTQLESIFTVQKDGYGYKFLSHKTYAMPNQVFPLSTTGAVVSDSFDAYLLEQMQAFMGAMGYQRLPIDNLHQADLVLVISKIGEDKWYLGGPETPHYFQGQRVAYPQPELLEQIDFSQGTVVVSLIDLDENIDDPSAVAAVWAGAMRGLLQSATEAKVLAGLQQVFAQSLYLNVGPPVTPDTDTTPMTDGGVFEIDKDGVQ